jgi:hypothetical protein
LDELQSSENVIDEFCSDLTLKTRNAIGHWRDGYEGSIESRQIHKGGFLRRESKLGRNQPPVRVESGRREARWGYPLEQCLNPESQGFPSRA